MNIRFDENSPDNYVSFRLTRVINKNRIGGNGKQRKRVKRGEGGREIIGRRKEARKNINRNGLARKSRSPFRFYCRDNYGFNYKNIFKDLVRFWAKKRRGRE